MLPDRDAVDHTAGRPQQWHDADEDISKWVDGIVARCSGLEGFVGAYLHGSLATGGFYRPRSDVDLLIVAGASPSTDACRELAVDLLALHESRPITGGLELSVVLADVAASFIQPTPYEFHFSEKWAEDVRRGGRGPAGVDPDLAIACTLTRHRGVTLAGPPAGAVFGDVPRTAYLEAIFDDLHWIVEDGIVQSPYYGVLNVCRSALVLLGDADQPPSKEEGATWCLAHLPIEHHPVISDALECYRAAAPINDAQRRHHGHTWDDEALLRFAAWAREALGIARRSG